MAVKYTNRATTLLAANITSGATSLSVTAATGSKFPALSLAGDWFPVVVVDAAGNIEIMRATARAGDVITVTRAQEGTAARAFNAGARVDCRLTAAAIDDILNAPVADGGVTTAKLADAAVTTAKIADGAVTSQQIADGAIATVDLADKAVTYGKFQDISATARLLGRVSALAGPVEEILLDPSLALSGGALAALNVSAPPENLVIKVLTNTTVSVTADAVTMFDGTLYRTFRGINTPVDLGTTGAGALDLGVITAGKWYCLWGIAKPDGTKSVIASLSFTAPAMPVGYTYKKRLGAVRTVAATATLLGTLQLGSEARYVVGLAQTTALPIMDSGVKGNPANGTWQPVAVANFVPPTASSIVLVLHEDNSSWAMVAPNNNYGAYTNSINPAPLFLNGPVTGPANAHIELMLESGNVYWASNGANSGLFCWGWKETV